MSSVLTKMKTEVWYAKPEVFRDTICGSMWLTEKNCKTEIDACNLSKTHVLLCKVENTHLEEVYQAMQGCNWSPNGEARQLITKRGLHHTSMSVGDIIVLVDEDKENMDTVFMVDNVGFKPVGYRIKNTYEPQGVCCGEIGDEDSECPFCGDIINEVCRP